MLKKSLLELQTTFSHAVQQGLYTSFSLHDVQIKNQPSISCTDRLFIYQNAYRLRILDSLREDFPRVLSFIGEDAFEELAFTILRQRPSCSWSLGEYSKNFVDVLTNAECGCAHILQKRPFLADLAQLEWLQNLSFLAPREDAFNFSHFFASLPEREMQNAVLELNPSVYLCCLQWSFSTLKKKKKPIQKEAFYLVYKKDGEVEPEQVSVNQFKILENIKLGLSIEQLCCNVVDTTQAEVTQWILEWVSKGVLARAKRKERSESVSGETQ